MALGGLDIEALRAELAAARGERTALLHQVSQLEASSEPLALSNGTETSEFHGSAAAPRAQTPPRPKRLSWGAPPPPAPPPQQQQQWPPTDVNDEPSLLASFAAHGAAAFSENAMRNASIVTMPAAAPPHAPAREASPMRAGGAPQPGMSPPPFLGGPFGFTFPAPSVGRPGSESPPERSPRPPPAAKPSAPGSRTDGPTPPSTTVPQAPAANANHAAAAAAGSAAVSLPPAGRPVSPAARSPPTSAGSATASVASASAAGAGGQAAFPRINLGAMSGSALAAAAGRAAAAAATTATTGQVAVPWAAHHSGNTAAAGVDLEAHKRMILKEVLAAVLNEPPSAPKLDHFKLDVPGVAAVVRAREAAAADEARAEAEAAAKAAASERQAKGAKAVEERAERALVEAKKAAEEDKRVLLAKLDKMRGQVEKLEKDRKNLQGKSAQNSRDAKESGELLMTAKQQLAVASSGLEAKSKALARAQAEMERVRADAERATAEAAKAVESARWEATAAAANAQQRIEAALEEQRQQHEAALASLRASRADRDVVAEGEQRELAVALSELFADVARFTTNTHIELAEAAEEVAGLKAGLAHMREVVHTEARDMREAAYAAIGGFHAACRTAAQAHRDRAAALAGVERGVADLGAGGLQALLRGSEQASAKIAELEKQVERLTTERDGALAGMRRMGTDSELKAHELAMLTAGQSEMAGELAAARAEAKAARADAAQLAAALEEARALHEQAKAHAQQLSDQLATTQDHLASERAALQQSRQQLEAAGAEVERWQAAAGAALAAGREQAAGVAAALVQELRDRYFQILPGHPSRGGLGHGAGGAAVAWGASPAAGGGGPDGALHEAESALGVRLCELSHDVVMAAFQSYTSRQALLAGGGGGGEGGERERAQLRSAPTAGAGGVAASAISEAAAAGAWQRPLVSELVWLEGCLLVALLDLRMLGPKGQAAASEGEEADLRSLVSQLLRGLASDRRQLQGHGKGAAARGAAPLAPHHVPGHQARRSLAFDGGATRASTDPGRAGGRSGSSGSGAQPAASSPAQQPQRGARRSVDMSAAGGGNGNATRWSADGLAEPAGSSGGAAGYAGTPLRLTATDCLLPPLPNPFSPSASGPMPLSHGGHHHPPQQQPDMDELMDILSALDESALRRSRGGGGLLTGMAGGGRAGGGLQPAWTDPPGGGGAGNPVGLPPTATGSPGGMRQRASPAASAGAGIGVSLAAKAASWKSSLRGASGAGPPGVFSPGGQYVGDGGGETAAARV